MVVAAKLFLAQAALPVLLLHGSVLPMQDFQRLDTIRNRHVNTAKQLKVCTENSSHAVSRSVL